MFMIRSVATVAGCSLLFAVIGGGIGLGVGLFNPDHYRRVFRDGQVSGFDPVSSGASAGLGEGAAGGACVGVLLVAIHVMAGLPRPLTSRPLVRRILTGVAAAMALGSCLGSTLFVGRLKGDADATRYRNRADQALVEPHLSADPAFAGLQVKVNSGDQGIRLDGRIPTEADRRRLREEVVRLFGEPRERMIMAGVYVERNQ